MKKLFVSLVILLIYSQLPAQTVWYFGNHASLDFTSGTPVSVANGQAINTGEGCTEAYDDKCNLLFYSDGITVWDKFNNIVVNGMNLQGSSTSTNSAIAVPVPGTNFENFYLFTVGDGSLLYNYVGVNGPRYSLLTNCKSTPVVDPVIKNVPLEPTRSSEKLAVTSDHNGGYWILAHGLTYLYGGGCYFYAYHLTNAGVLITTPVVSEIGTDHADVLANAQGQMKFSHDGSKVALAIMARRTVDLLNFNWNTGHLSSPKRVRFPDGSFYTGELDCQIYGIEFSQNNRFLYISGSYVTVGQPCKKRVYQVDLSNFAFDNNVNDYTTCGSTTMHETYFNSFSDINGLPGIRILYASPDNYYFQFGQMQYAPDGNIYLARKHITNPLQSNYLSRIENSNSVSATFNETAVSLLSGQANFEGLPFLLKDQNICPLSGITGFKYNDLDGDGVLDPKEPFLANWPINLTGDATKTTLTDANGHFTFDNLYAGTYTVSEPNVPGWVRTDPSFPSYTLTLGYNSTFLLGRAFGNHYREKCLYGYKFNDQNGNGVWDLGEPPVSGWEIHLIISNIYWTYTFTDANGFYLFDNFPDGPWYFVGETQQQGWNCTLPGQSSGYHIEPSALDNHVYYDFGNHKCINIPYDNMMGWWPMDELTGTTAKDIAGYNNEGTYHNTIEQVPGKVVAGLKFENTYPEFGSNNVDYVEIPDHPNLNFGESNPGIPGSGDFSIDTWFYYFQDQGETETIIAEKMNPSGTQGYSFFIRDGFLGLTLAAGTPVDFMSNVYIDAQYTWMHLAVTVDRDMSSDYGIRFYLDGNGYPGGNPVIVPESLTNDSPLKLGRRTVYERAFHILDEVELFNCVLTPEMVYSIYESDADGKCKPPVTVTISSVNPDHGVTIDVTPPDVSNKLGKGVTDAANTFKRYYLPNTSIYLKAPLSVGYWYYYFQKWMKNGADYVLYPNCNTGALITEDVNYTAVYHDCSVLGPVVGFETMKVCHGNIYIPVMSMHLDSIASLSFSFTLDTTELHFIGYQDCILDTVHGAFYMNEVGNTVFGAWYSLAPYSVDSGRMFTMVFEAAAGTHDLKWNLTGPGQCMVTDYDENIIPAIFLDGVLEVNRCSGVEGTLTYDNAVSTPLNNSLVLLKENGVVVKQDTTDAGGNYLMPDVFEGVYTLDAETNKPWGGVNATDAQWILKYFVHLIELNPLQQVAANVNMVSGVNSNDALSVAKRFVGINTHFVLPDWVFEHPEVNTGGAAVITRDFKGICAGDVDRSYTPGARLIPSISIGNEGIMSFTGDEIEIPVKVSSNLEVGAISLVIDLPGGCFSVRDVKIAGEGSLEFNQIGDELRIAWFTMEPVMLNPGDVLLTLMCRLNSGPVNNLSCRWNLGTESSLSDGDAQLIDNVYLTYPSLLNDPKEVYLGQNIPNPFNRYTEIPYYLPEDGKVTIKVFDMLGKVVMNLADEIQNSGTHQVRIDENNLRPGVYTYQLEFHNNNLQTCKSLKMVVN